MFLSMSHVEHLLASLSFAMIDGVVGVSVGAQRLGLFWYGPSCYMPGGAILTTNQMIAFLQGGFLIFRVQSGSLKAGALSTGR